MGKASRGNFFEDFSVGQEIAHAVPRMITSGDVALYSALYGMRFALQSSDSFARSSGGLPAAPVDNLLLFHIIFGMSVPDISLNAVGNLGYADCRFLAAAWPNDSFTARSAIIGLRENANGQTGIVYVRTTGYNQDGAVVLTFVRWVMIKKRDLAATAPKVTIPEVPSEVAGECLEIPQGLRFSGYDPELAGSPYLFEDYARHERIDHIDGTTIEEAEHQLATRLYRNTAKGHFDAVLQRSSKFGRRIVYGGHIISLARALSFNGLANGCVLAAINGGRHLNAAASGDTVYCCSEILDTHDFADRSDIGALRVRTVATKDRTYADFPSPDGSAAILLDLDYWLLMPRRPS